jgi:hypothetical protein
MRRSRMGKLASDGTIVYRAADGGADVAVQALSEGLTRVQSILRDAYAPNRGPPPIAT